MFEFLFYLFFPLVLGFITSISSNIQGMYNLFTKPSLAPPAFIFPIVWTILYLLMGFSSYLVRKDKKSINLYFLQLIINSIWTLIFFNLGNYLQGVVLIILLIIIVGLMIIRFYKVNKIASIINIPYLVWLTYALYLSYNIYLLNR